MHQQRGLVWEESGNELNLMCLGWRDIGVLHFQVKRELQAFGKDRWDSGLHIFRSEPAPVPSMQGGTSYTLEERSGPCEFSSWPRHGAGILLASSDSEEPSALTVCTPPHPLQTVGLHSEVTEHAQVTSCSAASVSEGLSKLLSLHAPNRLRSITEPLPCLCGQPFCRAGPVPLVATWAGCFQKMWAPDRLEPSGKNHDPGQPYIQYLNWTLPSCQSKN